MAQLEPSGVKQSQSGLTAKTPPLTAEIQADTAISRRIDHSEYKAFKHLVVAPVLAIQYTQLGPGPSLPFWKWLHLQRHRPIRACGEVFRTGDLPGILV
jgi:hypothetical protein